MSNSLKRLAASVVALSTVFTGFTGLITPVMADAPEIGGASLNSTTVYNDANAVEFTFTVSDSGNDDDEVLVVYHGYCVSDTLTAEVGQNTVEFKNVPDRDYLAGDCKVVVVNTDGEFSNVLNVPAFEVDTEAPMISVVVDVETPTDNTAPTFSFFSNEEGDIVESGECYIADSAVTSTTAPTTVVLYKNSANDPLDGDVYSDCKLKVVDEAGNESNELSINSFEVVDYISLDVQENSARPADPVNATSGRVRVIANVDGELTAGGDCEVYPRMITAGSTEVTLHSLVVGTNLSTATAGDCTLTLTPTEFEASAVTVEVDNLTGTGPLVSAVAAETTAPTITQSIAALVSQPNKGTVGFSFTSNEGGTWYIVDAPEAGTCSPDLTTAAAADLDDAIVHPSTSARTYLFEPTVPLANGTYGAAGSACEIYVEDANSNSVTFDMPQFTIADNKGPSLSVYEPVRNQVNTGTVEFEFTSDEYVPAVDVDLITDGDCFNGSNATLTNSFVSSDYENVLEIDLAVLTDNVGEFKFCQFSIADAQGNRSNSLVIPTFNVGLAGPELTDVEFPGGVTDNPVTISFESDEAGTFNLEGGQGCSVNDMTMDLPLQKGVNNVTFDNLQDGAYYCDVLPFDVNGVAGNPLLSSSLNFDIDTDEAADVTFESVDAAKLEIVFNSETSGYLSFAADSYCTSTQMVVKAGRNVVKLNKLPEGTAVSKCKFTVTNNDSSDTITVPPFTVAANSNVLAKLPDGAVYRFYNKTSGKHVMTQDYNEANTIFTSNPNWVYEGQVFAAYMYDKTTSACLDGAMPVYRYVNSAALSFVYVTSQAEMDALATNPAWIKEGVVFCAKDKDVTEAGTVKAIRFWNGVAVNHVYTIDPTEAAQIQANPQWVLEGTAFVVKPKLAQ